MQTKDADVLGFHRNLPPLQMERVDFRKEPPLKQKMSIPAPTLPVLPSIADIPDRQRIKQMIDAYIDPDRVNIYSR